MDQLNCEVDTIILFNHFEVQLQNVYRQGYVEFTVTIEVS